MGRTGRKGSTCGPGKKQLLLAKTCLFQLKTDQPTRQLPRYRVDGVSVNNKLAQVLLAVAIIAAVACLVAWSQARTELQALNARAVTSLLQPAAKLIDENEALLKELQTKPYAEDDATILVAYLAKIRRDGVPKHAGMRQRLDQLAENNVAIVTLLTAYEPFARTPALAAEVDRFRSYSAAWRDRWNSVMELFMAGGTYATTEVLPPAALSEKLQAEIAASR